MESGSRENGRIEDPGYFRIQYIHDEITPYVHHIELPLCAEVRIGSVTVGDVCDGEKIVMCAGYSFILGFYVDMIGDLQRGESATLVFDHERPIPIRFQPEGESCLVGLIKERIRPDAGIRFDKAAVRDQRVKLEEVVFQLAEVANDFLANVRDCRAFQLLDDLEAELPDYPDDLGLEEMFRERGKELFRFDRGASLAGSMHRMADKKEMYRYEKFMERLGCHERMVYGMLEQSMALLHPDKTNEDLYDMMDLSRHKE